MRNARPRLFVAGAGAAGTAVTLALHRAGWPVAEVACRSEARARQRCTIIGAGEPVCLEALCEPGRSAGNDPALLLVTVPDRLLQTMAGRLAHRTWPPDSVALHLSGSVEIDALAPLAASGLATGGLHLLKSFVDPQRDAQTLAGTVAALEGDPAALATGERIAEDLDAWAFRLTPGSRPAWHAAATHACNHLVGLVDQSLDLMETAGLDREMARAALHPLLAGTIANLAEHPPGQALTGPVVRGDMEAVARHLGALADASDDVGAAYRALARRLVRLARAERGLDEETAAEMLRSLADQEA